MIQERDGKDMIWYVAWGSHERMGVHDFIVFTLHQNNIDLENGHLIMIFFAKSALPTIWQGLC